MRSCRPLFAPSTRWPALGGSGEGRREHRNVNTLFPLARSATATLLTRSLRTQAHPAEPPIATDVPHHCLGRRANPAKDFLRPMCLVIPVAAGPTP
jgi:hypothetical protein